MFQNLLFIIDKETISTDLEDEDVPVAVYIIAWFMR